MIAGKVPATRQEQVQQNKNMPKLSQVFSGDYLKAEDLQGRSVPVIIESIEVKEFDDGNKLLIRFEGKEKSLVCNRTNASILQELLGSSDTDDWIGKRAVLVTKKVEFQGKLVPAIRFSLEHTQPTPQKHPQVQLPEDGTDSVPF